MLELGQLLPASAEPIALFILLLTAVVHIAFAFGVYQDAGDRRRVKQTVWFVGPIIWAGGTLLGGLIAAALYWLVHYSTLAPPDGKPPREGEGDGQGGDAPRPGDETGSREGAQPGD